MGLGDFGNLSTEQFRVKMRPAAIAIYRQIFPGCELEDLREKGFKVHVLDVEFGIDSLVKFHSGQWISLQEKYRSQSLWRSFHDFTQEYKNGVGTLGESPGEWFHLGAQLYFYGWSNKEQDHWIETGPNIFEHWVLIDITKYKCIIEDNGGIEKLGQWMVNWRFGRAGFYGLPLELLYPAVIRHHDVFDRDGKVLCPNIIQGNSCDNCSRHGLDRRSANTNNDWENRMIDQLSFWKR